MATYLSHNKSVHIILFYLKKIKKIFSDRKKDIGESVHENRYSVMQIMTAKITILWKLYVHVVSNSLMFPQILYDIVLYSRHFLPVKFFLEYYFYELFFQLPQNVAWTDE